MTDNTMVKKKEKPKGKCEALRRMRQYNDKKKNEKPKGKSEALP
jgi:hypothetical protein